MNQIVRVPMKDTKDEVLDNEPYVKISDQEDDWKPVIKNFISDCGSDELVEIKKVRPLVRQVPVFDEKLKLWCWDRTYGVPQTRITLGKAAKEQGYRDVRRLFNDWFNKRNIFKPNPYVKDENEKTFE